MSGMIGAVITEMLNKVRLGQLSFKCTCGLKAVKQQAVGTLFIGGLNTIEPVSRHAFQISCI